MFQKPFLKWAGNKYQILCHIIPHIPSGHRIIEPFAGTCSVSINAPCNSGIISDLNEDIINMYNCLKYNKLKFIKYCKSFFIPDNNIESQYYNIRKQFNLSNDQWYKSAAFVYLNRHCFNGLCRYNSKHQFNVPFGKYKKPYFPESEMINFSKIIDKFIFKCIDFKEAFKYIESGDIIYCDPPYIPIKSNSFTQYINHFTVEHHKLLLQNTIDAIKKNVVVIISNSASDYVYQLYKSCFTIQTIRVKRFISANGNRNTQEEVIAIFK